VDSKKDMKGKRVTPPKAFAWGGKRYVLLETYESERDAMSHKKKIEKQGDKSRIKSVCGHHGVYFRGGNSV